ncbi:putative secreted protein [Propionispora sp. 2/2-37]|uniref:DHA2 family efflux MFS transporter permease subunit n=1 Tax=Propionispora sp. 2/2-37 TaxID=1677858 RepID=UPI0006C34809|nr:DHA2 family efflux MFS transporter permease subunit [Propionispora sp. 2/2-37]CUH94722.1 putative secreted protein [Propionispora sp. 2/2-37]
MVKYFILCAVCLGTVLSAYVSSCVNIALPNIMAALNFNMDSVVWVSLGYMLPYGSILPLTGKLGDQFGAKLVYVLGMIIFTVASLLCGLATSSTAMIVFRIIQGVGAGMLLPNAMTIVAQTFEPHERGQALGIWSAMAAAGSAMGPTIGGYLIEFWNWRWVFFSVGPVCIISVIFALAVIPRSSRSAGVSIDYLGAVFLITSISSLLVALNQGQKEGWESLYIFSLFYVAFVAFVIFLLVEFSVEKPMIDMRLFSDLTFSVANLVGFISFVGFYGGNFLLPFFLKSIMDYSSTTAGLMILPMTASMVIFSPIGGRLADRFGSRLPAVTGIMLIAFSLYLLDTISADYSNRDFFIRLSLFGMGLGLTMSPLTNCAVSTLPKNKIGVGSGIFNLAKIIGGSIGVVFAETLLTRREIYHTAVLKEYLTPAAYSSQEISRVLRALWGDKGMDDAMISAAAHGWLTGQGLLPQQYAQFKLLLNSMITRQSSILSFQDVFFTVSIVCFAGGILALFIRRRVAA